MRRALIFIFLLSGSAVHKAQAQTLLNIDEAVAKQNLIKQVSPVYPPIARAAQVTGDVVLQVEIDSSGKVSGTKVLSGPPMLRGAAIEAVKAWEFKPFEQNGAPIEVSTKIVIPFSLGVVDKNDQQIAEVFFPLSETCHKLVGQKADPAEEVKACREAALQADKFGSNSRFIERRSAYVYFATSLIRTKEFKEAVFWGHKAVAVVQQGHDDGSGSSAAYGVRAQAEAFGGNLAGADKDLETAENFQRTALNSPAGQDLNKSYTQGLKSLLSFHAQVLSALGKPSEADTKSQEAAKL